MASVKAIFNFGEELTIRSETPPGGGQLMRFVQTVTNQSIKTVYTNLLAASKVHLMAFSSKL